MRQKIIMPLGIVLLILLIGCGAHQLDVAWQEARPLGRDLTISKPPIHVPTVEESTQLQEPTGTINLRQALTLALTHNPDLKAFSWAVRAGEAKTLQAGLRPNPELETEIEEFGGSGDLSGFSAIETTIQLGVPIDLGGVRRKQRQIAGLEAELAGWDYETARLDVLTQVNRAFIDVLAAQEVVTLNEELVRLAEQVFNTAKAQVEAGKVSPVQQMRTQVELANSRISLETSKRELEGARFVLAATWGSTSPTFEKVEGQFEMATPIPTVEQFADRVTQNPNIVRWTAEIAHRSAAIQLERSRRVPDLSIDGGMKHLSESGDVAFILGLSLPLPLFDRNQGAIREAEYNLAKAFEEQKSAEVTVRTALATAYSALSAVAGTVSSLKNEVLPSAQGTFDAVTEGYRIGKFDFLEMLDAQRTLFDVKGSYIDALAKYHKAVADVERLIGESLR